MTVSVLSVLLIVIVAAAVLLAVAWAYSTANRLDRLHVRVDHAWLGLDAALARRAVVARSIAASGAGGPPLVVAADRAETASRDDRERVENELSLALAEVDRTALSAALVAELADAEARVSIARRFFNDGVRDTLALRGRRPVRWLHLGGTAPLPRYFEIAERGALPA